MAAVYQLCETAVAAVKALVVGEGYIAELTATEKPSLMEDVGVVAVVHTKEKLLLPRVNCVEVAAFVVVVVAAFVDVVAVVVVVVVAAFVGVAAVVVVQTDPFLREPWS